MSPLHDTMDIRACRALWVAVLTGLLRDLCGDVVAKGAGIGQTEARERAEAWVGNWPGRDFRMVCDCAGLDGDAVHARLRALIDLPVAHRRNRLAGLLSDRNAPTEGPALSPDARRDRVTEMLDDGVTPSEMSGRFAAEGLPVSITTIRDDLKRLRRTGRIGTAGPPVRVSARAPVEGSAAHV